MVGWHGGLVLSESLEELVRLDRLRLRVVKSESQLLPLFQDLCDLVCPLGNGLLTLIDTHYCTVVEQPILLDFPFDLLLYLFNVWF